MKVCSLKNCDNKYHAKGYCQKHYLRFKTHGVVNPIKEKRFCDVDGCGKKHLSKGFCPLHYQRFLRHGDPLIVLDSTKHGLCYTDEYKIWEGIKKRCKHKEQHRYKNYAGRGIKICDEWKNNFIAFLKYVGPRPSKEHSIDRIDVNGNYEPGNVRWADKFTQARNTRKQKNNTSGIRGVSYEKGKNRYRAYISFESKRIFLGTFKNLDDAVKARKEAELKYW